MPFTVKDLTYAKDALDGITAKTIEAHHDRLYAGYVNKRNEIDAALPKADKSKAAATYSEYRALKLEETFNADGQILHELYFAHLGGKGGHPTGALLAQIEKDFGSVDEFIADVSACGMASRGWATVAYDPTDGKIHSFLGDAHNHGGVWGAVPLMTLDVYEHAYFMDYGTARAEYIKAFWRNVDWSVVEKNFESIARH
ncbi:MAG: superoxide dismutase [Chloroflexota bacterium]|jgi:Fe-Mn family superoxide dismutase|nr:superoxide dismutase [Chloroflexota bacterium]NCA15098.1 superoxide dismutase [Pseudomonadota bacterium]